MGQTATTGKHWQRTLNVKRRCVVRYIEKVSSLFIRTLSTMFNHISLCSLIMWPFRHYWNDVNLMDQDDAPVCILKHLRTTTLRLTHNKTWITPQWPVVIRPVETSSSQWSAAGTLQWKKWSALSVPRWRGKRITRRPKSGRTKEEEGGDTNEYSQKQSF